MSQTMRHILASMRPQQWVKNFFVFAALIFAGHLRITQDVVTTCFGFAFFCLVASSVYLFNDIIDLEKDKLHPAKAHRPLPSGKLSVSTAAAAAAVLALVGLLGGFMLKVEFGAVLLLYVVLNILYSLKLKETVILDVMTISAGFVLRVVGGAFLVSVPTSEWLIICTVLLSLFLGFSKRRHELTILEAHANTHRAVLQHYSPYFLDQMIGIVTASTVMSYTLYTISEDTILKFGTNNLIYTVPFVLYGIFRYLYLVHRREEGGNPTKIALTDRPLLLNMVLWILTACYIIYGR